MKSREWHNDRVFLQWHPSSLMCPRIAYDGWEQDDGTFHAWVALSLADGNCDPFLAVEVQIRGRLARLLTLRAVARHNRRRVK